jgi:hypothetical protein
VTRVTLVTARLGTKLRVEGPLGGSEWQSKGWMGGGVREVAAIWEK